MDVYNPVIADNNSKKLQRAQEFLSQRFPNGFEYTPGAPTVLPAWMNARREQAQQR